MSTITVNKEEVIKKVLDNIFSIKSYENNFIKTGFTEFDMNPGPMMPRGFYIVAGVSSIGKTDFVLNLVKHNMENGKKVLYFTNGTPAEELITRMISIISGVAISYANSKKYNAEETEKIESAANILKGYDLTFIEKDMLSIEDISNTCLDCEQAIDIVVVESLNNVDLSSCYFSAEIKEPERRQISPKHIALNQSVMILATYTMSLSMYEKEKIFTTDYWGKPIGMITDGMWLLNRPSFYDHENTDSLIEIKYAQKYPMFRVTNEVCTLAYDHGTGRIDSKIVVSNTVNVVEQKWTQVKNNIKEKQLIMPEDFKCYIDVLNALRCENNELVLELPVFICLQLDWIREHFESTLLSEIKSVFGQEYTINWFVNEEW